MEMVPPWRINDLLDRAENGPIILERDFDLKIFVKKLREVIKTYDIRFDPEDLVPHDDSLADSVWKAAWDLYLEVGTYCVDTHRRILFEEEEIKEAMSLFPEKIWVGSGKDARELYHRQIEDGRKPFCVFSPSLPFSEELFLPAQMAFMQEPLADGAGAPEYIRISGRDNRTRGPFEIQAAQAHAGMIREAARRAGRPGIYLADVQSAVSDAAQIAASNPDWGVRLTDGRMVGTIAELKISNWELNKMVHFHQSGYLVMALFGPMYGGYCGGAEGVAVVNVASHLQGLMVNQGHMDVDFPFDIRYGNNTSRELLWATSVTWQALARNTPFMSMSNGMAAAGPCTEMVLCEAAAHGLVSTVSGAHLWECFAAGNKHQDRTTPMEARIACEVGHAVAKMGMKREDASEIALEMVKRYEKDIPSAPLGKRFQECYDVAKVKPTAEYSNLYRTVKKELQNLGIQFPY